MSSELVTIITTVISCGTVVTFLNWLRDRKADKKIKNNEASKSSVDVQRSEIDLGNLYKEEMLKVIELLKNSQSENTGNQEEMKKMLLNIDRRVDNMEELLSAVVKYLNGNFQQFLAELQLAKKKEKEAGDESVK